MPHGATVQTRTRFWLALSAIAIAATAQAAAARYGHALSVDEPFTATALTAPWNSIVAQTFTHDNVPLYYVVLKAWTSMAGMSESMLRVPSLVAFALAVLLAGLAGRTVGGTAAGLASAALMATSTRVGLHHAANARAYALACLLASLIALICTDWIRRPSASSSRHVLALCLAGLAGLFTHPVFGVLLLAVTLSLPVAVPRAHRIWAIAAPTASVAVYLATWGQVLAASAELPATAWMAQPGIRSIPEAWLQLWDARVGLVLVGVLAALGLSDRAVRLYRTNGPLVFVTMIPMLAVAIAWTISQWRPIFHVDRTMTFLLPFVAVAVGTAIATLASRALLLFTLALCAAGSVHYSVGSWMRGDPAPTPASVASLLDRARCGDTIVVAGLAYAAVEHYAPRLHTPDCLTRVAFPSEMAMHPGWIDVRGLTEDNSPLAAEAAALTTRLAREDGRVWLVGLSGRDGTVGYEATLFVHRALEQQFERAERFEWRGGFFDEVVLFDRGF